MAPIDEDAFYDHVLAHAPEYIRDMREAKERPDNTYEVVRIVHRSDLDGAVATLPPTDPDR